MTLSDLIKLFGLVSTLIGFGICALGGAEVEAIILGAASIGGVFMIKDTWGEE
jgi:hypothetical protein